MKSSNIYENFEDSFYKKIFLSSKASSKDFSFHFEIFSLHLIKNSQKLLLV